MILHRSSFGMETPLRQPVWQQEEAETNEPRMLEGDGDNFAITLCAISDFAMPEENRGPVFALPPSPQLQPLLQPDNRLTPFSLLDNVDVNVLPQASFLQSQVSSHNVFQLKTNGNMQPLHTDLTCKESLDDMKLQQPEKMRPMSSLHKQVLTISANCDQCKLRKAKELFGLEKYVSWTNPDHVETICPRTKRKFVEPNTMIIDSMQLLQDWEEYEHASKRFKKAQMQDDEHGDLDFFDLMLCEKHACGAEIRGLRDVGSAVPHFGMPTLKNQFKQNKVRPDAAAPQEAGEEPVGVCLLSATAPLRRLLYEDAEPNANV